MLDFDQLRKLKKLEKRLNRAEVKPPGNGTAFCPECCEPLTNGDPVNPEIIFADGDVVMVCEVP